jgi:hypothetical protein
MAELWCLVPRRPCRLRRGGLLRGRWPRRSPCGDSSARRSGGGGGGLLDVSGGGGGLLMSVAFGASVVVCVEAVYCSSGGK